MKVILIQPDIPYVVHFTIIQPLSIAILYTLTPQDVEVKFYDDRLENIPYDEPADLVGITVNTLTVRRAYQITEEFRKRGVPVVLGGIHPTLVPREAIEYCDSVVIGEAEDLWPKVISDVQKKNLQRFYYSSTRSSLEGLKPNREIFKGKRYITSLALVEFGRGCKYKCNFCCISVFYKQTYRHRPLRDVIEEIEGLGKKIIQFSDDNIITEPNIAKKLFSALIPLKIKWMAQASVDPVLLDEELLNSMAKSGCIGLFIGFESLERKNLNRMGKTHNIIIGDYNFLIKNLKNSGISILGNFLFGYDYDDKHIFKKTLKFAIENKFFAAAFQSLRPYPGTLLYKKLLSQGRLIYDKWWLEKNYKFGDTVFRPLLLSPKELQDKCEEIKAKFYSWPSLFKRIEFKANCKNIYRMYIFLINNIGIIFKKLVNCNFLLYKKNDFKRDNKLSYNT
jgi:radical SAM superfamily enzyme YgiQ (UPF0313 family)